MIGVKFKRPLSGFLRNLFRLFCWKLLLEIFRTTQYCVFAAGTRELTGAVDLISHYQLREHYESFCKKPLPTKVSDSNYLSNVVGDTELRRGEGMELSQLISGPAMTSMPSDRVPFQPFDLEVLRKAFTLKEAGPIFLPEVNNLAYKFLIYYFDSSSAVCSPILM